MTHFNELQRLLEGIINFVYMYQSEFFTKFHPGSNELITFHLSAHHARYTHSAGLDGKVRESHILYVDLMAWITSHAAVVSKSLGDGGIVE